ncbi:MAG: hypothetical protein H6559_24930 [Lewinellaceae bacterium]|nr:hypothetical protein [Lewinellaceae bacterium]
MNIAYDLQITLMGHALIKQLFETIGRNLTQRWAIRYEGLEVEVLADRQGFSNSLLTAVRVKNAAAAVDPAKICVTYVPGHRIDHTADYMKIASYLKGAKRNCFIWVVSSKQFEPGSKENLLESALNMQLISLGQVLQAMEQQNELENPVLHVMELEKRLTTFKFNKVKYGNARPWAGLRPGNDKNIEQAVRDRIPHLYEVMTATVEDIRFHNLPWGKQGSHLDFAPRWIDLFVYDALNWNIEHIIQWHAKRSKV